MRRFAVAAALAVVAVASPSRAQIPEKFTNLKVLPRGVTRDQLVQTMRGFANALGVRCSHCHVNTQPEDLKTFDFASDDKEAKRVARAMMKMTQAINAQLLPETGRSPLRTVACMTCHHGLAQPEQLIDVLEATMLKDGVAAALAKYGALREKYYGQAVYDFSMRTLNMLAEKLGHEKRFDDAVTVQEYNVKVNPGIASSHRLLADLYLDKGDRAAARTHFERAVALDPGDAYYKRRLQEMLASPSPR